jgi:hypothetical protein
MNRLFPVLFFLIVATVVGCPGGGPSYANVKGTVRFNGQPLDKGQITFAMEGRPPSTMDIVDGKFSGQAMVGSNKISVSARKKSATQPKLSKDAEAQIKGYKEYMRGKGQGGGDPNFDPSEVEYIPPEWGTQSKQMRVVEAGSPNELEFDIKGPTPK